MAPSDGRVKFGDLARRWLDSKHNLKRSTRARYEITRTRRSPSTRDMALGDISRQFVREFVADLNRTLAPLRLVHKTVGVLRQVLAMAVTDNRLAMNPVDGIELPSVTARWSSGS